MNWFRRTPTIALREPHARPMDADALLSVGFVCSTCGRTDLPETGGWDPPICQECDAAINEDAMREADDPDLGW